MFLWCSLYTFQSCVIMWKVSSTPPHREFFGGPTLGVQLLGTVPPIEVFQEVPHKGLVGISDQCAMSCVGPICFTRNLWAAADLRSRWSRPPSREKFIISNPFIRSAPSCSSILVPRLPKYVVTLGFTYIHHGFLMGAAHMKRGWVGVFFWDVGLNWVPKKNDIPIITYLWWSAAPRTLTRTPPGICTFCRCRD